MALNMHKILHESRTALLRNLDGQDKNFVSIGANGGWYFDWIHSCCGTPAQHIGVEYYLPEPDILPANVRWVANTAGSMPDVRSGIADVVFSGQNIEHLWMHDVQGFLCETHRILKEGGLLVLDSPNRHITSAYNISHPEHMIEFTPDEMHEILNAAGFDVQNTYGIYLCRDPRSGAILPYLSDDEDPPFSILERSVSGPAHPNDSYIWWINATRGKRKPDLKQLETLLDDCWKRAWPERMRRMLNLIGTPGVDGAERVMRATVGEIGALLYGPYAPIDVGQYKATLWVKLESEAEADSVVAVADVTTEAGEIALASTEIFASALSISHYMPITVRFSLETMNFGFQCRLYTRGNAAMSVKNNFDLEKLNDL